MQQKADKIFRGRAKTEVRGAPGITRWWGELRKTNGDWMLYHDRKDNLQTQVLEKSREMSGLKDKWSQAS